MKHLFKIAVFLGLTAGMAHAGPSQPPAGNYIQNTSTIATKPTFNVSSGTVDGNFYVNGNTLSNPGLNIRGGTSLILSNSANSGNALLSNNNSAGTSSLLVTAVNGVGINRNPINGSDLTISTFIASSGTIVGPLNVTRQAVFIDSQDVTSDNVTIIGSPSYGIHRDSAMLHLKSSSTRTCEDFSITSDPNNPLGICKSGSGTLSELDFGAPGVTGGMFATFSVFPSTTIGYASAYSMIVGAPPSLPSNQGDLGVGHSLSVSSTTNLNGNVIFSSAVTLSNGVGTNGQVFTSGGPGTTPTWTTSSGGSGDVVKASTQTFTGGNTFASSTTFSGNVVISSTIILNASPGNNFQVLTSSGSAQNPTWRNMTVLQSTSAEIVNHAIVIGASSGTISNPCINSLNLITFTPKSANSTIFIWITSEIEIDSGTGYINMELLFDGVPEQLVRSLMYAPGILMVQRPALMSTKAFGDTSQHTIQIGGYSTGPAGSVSGTNSHGTTYMIQEVL